MVALPVSRLEVTLRPPAGEDEVLVFESVRRDMTFTVDLLSRLADADGASVACAALPVTDVEALLLELRRQVYGEIVRGYARCGAAGCRARVDVSFRLSDYLAHHEPRTTAEAVATEEDGWFALRNTAVAFRIPLASDQMAVAGKAEAERLLIARCVRPPELPTRLLGRVARAMQAVSPSLADVIEGVCPECEMPIAVFFDPRDFTLRELSASAATVFEDAHLLASRYHWSEERILRMPASRRARYAEMIRDDEAEA